MLTETTIEQRIGHALEDGQVIFMSIESLLKSYSVCEQDMFAAKLAFEEAYANAFRHGNRSDPSRNIYVAFTVKESPKLFLNMRIRDQGNGFDHSRLNDPTADENLESPNGRGVFLMKAYMTTVIYNKKGNEVTMTRDLCKK